MEAKDRVHGENMKLLKEIYNLKMKLNDMYIQSGPNSSDYINLSIKLNVLEKKYMEEKLTMFQEELVNKEKPQGNQQSKFIRKFQKVDKMEAQPRKSPVWHVLLQR